VQSSHAVAETSTVRDLAISSAATRPTAHCSSCS